MEFVIDLLLLLLMIGAYLHLRGCHNELKKISKHFEKEGK
jgi:hypothetical protein